MDLKDRAQQLKKDIPAVFLALKNSKTPWYAKALAILTISYALSPIDLIPDFLPVVGYLDDIIILPLLVAVTIKFIPKHIFEACRMESEHLLNEGNAKKWYYAIPIILIWLMIFVIILKIFLF